VKNNRIYTQRIKHLFWQVQMRSIQLAAREQDLTSLVRKLTRIVPDISDQYTASIIDSPFRRLKGRTQHAFQIRMVLKALDLLDIFVSNQPFLICDIGDSSGNHITYLKQILKRDKRFAQRKVDFLGVNLDPVAVEKIRRKGIKAVLCRAEELSEKITRADLFLSFEMLEHLYDPISFLNAISERNICDCIVATVPYLKQSRIGLRHIRKAQLRDVSPENTHILELSPEDWKLVFMHSGWRIADESIYRQYPIKSIFALTKPLWKRFDFEGFYGVVLRRDRKWADCYK